MIQRLQSVYLFLMSIIMLAMLIFPIAGFFLPDSSMQFIGLSNMSSYSLVPGFVLPSLVLLVGILALITIFIYKKRLIQIKLSYAMLIILVLIYVFIAYFYTTLMAQEINNLKAFPKIAMSFPLIAIILDFLAISGIKKDEKLVNSLNRIR